MRSTGLASRAFRYRLVSQTFESRADAESRPAGAQPSAPPPAANHRRPTRTVYAEDRLIHRDRNLPRGNGENQRWNLTKVGDWQTYDGDELVQVGSGGLTAFGQTRTHNPVHEIQTIDNGATVFNLLHDPKGNLTRDAPGSGQTYAWDFDNKLTEARDSSGNLLGTYTYDALAAG